MLQRTSFLIALLIIAALLLIPLLCIILYRGNRLRTCLIFSHLWCMIAFCLLGMFLLRILIHHKERSQYSGDARRLLEMAKNVRQGDTREAITHLDQLMASKLFRTAYDVPDDKMAQLDPDILWVWQEVKEYYDTYKVKDPAHDMRIARKLAQVPWSDWQLAIKKFEQTYQSGERALAPAINMRSWLGPALTDEELKDKLILLDFWNIHCGPCIASLPELQEIHDTYKDRGLVVIACAGGNKKKTKEFLDKKGYHFPAGMSSHQMLLDYAVRGNPSYFMIDRDGYLAWGPQHRLPTADELSSLLEKN